MVQDCRTQIPNSTDQCTSDSKIPSAKPPPVSEKTTLDDYEPHSFGKKHNPTIFWGPIFHLLKCIIGTGVLTLPYIFQSVGYAVAIFGTLLVAFLYIHILHILLDVEYQLCKKLKTPSLTYVCIVQHTLEQGPRFSKRFIPAAKLLTYFHYVFNKSLMNAVYLLTISGNFKIIIDHYYGTNANIVTIMTIVLVPLIGLALIRDLKFLVPLSMVTNLFIIANLFLIIFIPTNYNGLADLKAINDISQFPNFFSTILGSLECTGLSLPMKSDMRNPKRFTDYFGVLNIALLSATILYCTFGVLGVAKYGDRLQPNVLFNLPPDHFVSLVILSLQSFALCISFILFMYIAFDTIWKNLFSEKKVENGLLIECGLRIGLCILPYLIAIALPDFRIMITLTFVMGIVMDDAVPPVLHVFLLMKHKSKSTRTYLIILKDIVLTLICSYVFVATLVDVVRSIVKFYN